MPLSLALEGTVIVSGGNRGIGYELSRSVAESGAQVAIIYRSAKDADEVAAKISKEFNVPVKAFQCDVTDQESVKIVVNKVDKEFGPVTGLIANAGVAELRPALELTRADFDKIYNVNVYGVFNTAQAVAQLWVNKKFEKGSIVIISSMSGEIYNTCAPNQALTQVFYNSSKAAVTHLGKCLAGEWAQHKIRVNTVAPGYVNTDQTKDHPEEIKSYQAKNTPLGRFCHPSEQAPSAIFLLSDKASFITGATIINDGGYTIW
ncbi:hypothetical protein E3Q24_01902 [Wallemia mellicola]|nr:hypothetical protein E3Q24_01902 [Wallemia mellicola]TIC17919.1 NAD(P)-binding protein [Wallemia mellicola]TIC59605.1 NAD(P)-binding protein [Wallemia mellicola]